MKKLFLFILPVIILLGCGPVSKLYQTPPVYFGTAHAVPVTDSCKQLSVSFSLAFPVAAELKSEYRLNKNFSMQLGYHGNVFSYSNYRNNNIDYRYSTTSGDLQLGYSMDHNKNNVPFFVLFGIGKGKTVSIVDEWDGITEFHYRGKYSRITVTPGIQFLRRGAKTFSISWRQSFVHFKNYELPEVRYSDKKQFLSDLMLNYQYQRRKAGFNLFMGSFLNGMQGGERNFDRRPGTWRIERLFGGLTLNFRLRT